MKETLKYFLLYCTIFIWSSVAFRSPAEIYTVYFVIFLYMPLFIIRHGVPKAIPKIFIPLGILGVVYISLDLNTAALFLKIYVGVLASSLFYYYILAEQEFNVKEAMRRYYKFAWIVTIIGLIQFVSFNVGFGPGYAFKWIFNKWGSIQEGGRIRINSVFSEPAYYAAMMAPAMFLSFRNLLTSDYLHYSKWKSIITIGIYLLTFSSLGITAVFIALLLLLLNLKLLKYIVVLPFALFFASTYAYNNIEDFRERLDSTIGVFSTGDINRNKIHGSSYVLYNNYHVAIENWKSNPIFGTGLGSHLIAFDKYSLTNQAMAIKIEFNKSDANSLFLRLLSETGIVGLGLFLFLVFKCYVGRGKAADEQYWIISNGILLIILVYLLRQGHYFYNGFPFFVWMYYYTWKNNQEALSEEVDPELATAPSSQKALPNMVADA